ncbi:2-aminoethylphosphonate--pyruvate transaminase [Flavihumibacter petaseus]|uniref:2-aminoethylphosphonate--pyruvate transaminase n=1 Tax=Flavihumibacter petaseus NBRC 106054 TaxID=1220578 RepID=A0A0E9N476_9BACT|nr:2-aminoethylphosphonate--pyruvate transaminase [Flavihumibacter petaseus]GAO44629.1 2-aminoethylphosphonate--pyruvate transaminase [Flavihumibacter petaseus NBRC 106054]
MSTTKLLFTPGPLSTSLTVKEAMLQDMGSRDDAFVQAVKAIRSELLALAHVSKEDGYETVIMQGSGTFGVESVISSVVGKNDQLLILANGAYGERIATMAAMHQLNHIVVRCPENEIVTAAAVEATLQQHPAITHVACIHSETTTGLFNPIGDIGAVCARLGKVFIVDAMSSFGGTEMDMKAMHIDFLVSSSNKCIEGVPGFAFALCKRSELEKAKGQARSLSLDLYAQWAGLEASGQFRFTPPTLSLMAFRQAMQELQQEGGITAREKRYRNNKAVLDAEMAKLGFRQYLDPAIQGHIITSFLYPADPAFHFGQFYEKLNQRGFVIYPGKLGKTDAFRIGNIGQIYPDDVRGLVAAIGEVLAEMGVKVA